jgi:hypothetical protein
MGKLQWNEENTWEPRRNLNNAQEALSDFYDKYPTAVRRLVQILREEKKKIIVDLDGGHEGVFEAKTEDKKGYCQNDLTMQIRRV